ncbi:hypothetical protein K469DRAFT_361642 [Zopfia rhizophila CBS 207.26]|uniref:Uncharacterized protein n=1 Tax=Zopfia rhizophila CBS 207.26 TaxID=1314779 RepID=A0A6A6EJU7_9PEZI|nr:hypothetical protein K469DRAFT_361642 [Zopfia rhizophila CBS 207.26]
MGSGFQSGAAPASGRLGFCPLFNFRGLSTLSTRSSSILLRGAMGGCELIMLMNYLIHVENVGVRSAKNLLTSAASYWPTSGAPRGADSGGAWDSGGQGCLPRSICTHIVQPDHTKSVLVNYCGRRKEPLSPKSAAGYPQRLGYYEHGGKTCQAVVWCRDSRRSKMICCIGKTWPSRILELIDANIIDT